jgi:AcrR family transcriptional regulator
MHNGAVTNTGAADSIDWRAVQLPGRKGRQRGEQTRRRLILAAADLFAERGIDGVGSHEILERAGQRNVSAIQYHFGSRAGLVVAVLQPREDVRGPIERDRGERLAAIAASGTPTLRDAVETFIMPSLACLATHEGRSLIRVAAQVMRTLPLDARIDPTVPTDREVTALIASLLPGSLSPAVRRERLGVARTLVIELVANRAREREHGLTPHLDDAGFARELVAMTLGLLSAD